MELLEKLAALTPRPRINLILYHGVLAPHARWRAQVVAYGALSEIAATAPNLESDSGDDEALPEQARHWAWATLMRAILDNLAVSAALLDRPPPAAMMEPALLATKV